MAKAYTTIGFSSEELAAERWRQVAGTADHFFVSSLGRVRSCNFRGRHARILVQTIVNRYLSVGVTIGGKRRTKRVHALVAEAFLGPRPPGAEVNHKDCNRLNNRAVNLEWTTRAANRAHYAAHRASRQNSTATPFVDSGNAKLTIQNVLAIRDGRSAGLRIAQLATEYGVSTTTICNLLSGRTWAWL